MNAEIKGEILRQYVESHPEERLHLFLQFPNLRRPFQKIDRKELASKATSSHEDRAKVRYPFYLSFFRGVYQRIIEMGALKSLLKSLKPI